MISHSLGHGSTMRQNKKCLTRNIFKKGQLLRRNINLLEVGHGVGHCWCRVVSGMSGQGRCDSHIPWSGSGAQTCQMGNVLSYREKRDMRSHFIVFVVVVVVVVVFVFFFVDFTDFSPISFVFVLFSIYWLVLPISNNFSTSFHAYKKGLFKCCVACSIFYSLTHV